MKHLLLFIFATLLISNLAVAQSNHSDHLRNELQKLEKNFDGRIGVYAIDTNSNQIIAYRAEERFPVQSTFKLMGVSDLLNASSKDSNLLQKKIHYIKSDLMFWSPVTEKHVNDGMTFEALSEAAMSYSDNAAINIIMKKLGGPKHVTDFAHAIGNKTFNVEHYESNLNSNPQYTSDTSTPKDMAISLQKLTLGNVLGQSQRKKLVSWMRNNTTSYKRMRAGVPIGWVVADKTGSGDYGIANDIGIMWSSACKPIVLAIYTIRNKADAVSRDDIVASTTTVVLNELAKSDECFKFEKAKWMGK